MRRVLWLLPLLAVAGCKEETPQGAVKVTVTYEGFKPGCVRVLARDANGSGETLSKDVEGKGEATGGSLVIAVLPQEDWGTQVELEAGAFERADCTGKEVVNRSASVTLTPGTASPVTLALIATDGDGDGYVSVLTGGTDCNDNVLAINPGVTEERCNNANDVDDNCNGQSDQQELRLGQSCTEGASCAGTRRCGDNGQVVCSVPNAVTVYPDTDGDGHGDKNQNGTVSCNGVPAGFSSLRDDCDDRGVTVYGGAPEVCDGLDNDCDEAKDETFADLGMTCTDSASQCGGTLQCNGAGTATACVRTQPIPTWYPDDDGDGYGREPGTQTTCTRPAGAFVNQGGDCEDGNPFNHPNRTELCDGLDNNCDSQVEAAEVCPAGGPTWADRGGGSTSQNWYAASTWTPGGVWVTGDGNRRALLRPGDTTFAVSTQGPPGCGSSTSRWFAVWADPTNGRAYFGAESGRLAYQDTTDANCIQTTDTSNDLAVFGMVGLRANGSLSLYGVSESTSFGSGAAFSWDGATSLTFNSASNDIAYVYDMHGVSRDALFAVGGYEPGTLGGGPRIYRFNAANGQWLTANVQSIPGLARFNGVWVVNEKLAFAVGLSGSVARWNGSAWSKVSFPNTTDELTSVVAFGATSVYATAGSGSNSRIYRYNGQDWQQLHEVANVRFYDITGTSPADLWVVGTGGQILHWPQ